MFARKRDFVVLAAAAVSSAEVSSAGCRFQLPLGRFQFRDVATEPGGFELGAGCQMLIDDRTGQTESHDHYGDRRDRDGERRRRYDMLRHIK